MVEINRKAANTGPEDLLRRDQLNSQNENSGYVQIVPPVQFRRYIRPLPHLSVSCKN